jgi:hypothetical protein
VTSTRTRTSRQTDTSESSHEGSKQDDPVKLGNATITTPLTAAGPDLPFPRRK